MIRKMRKSELTRVMSIWLESNIKAHDFIEETYWKDRLKDVTSAISEAEVYVFEDEGIKGFVGLLDTYIAGIFVDPKQQSYGIGQQLLDYVKELKGSLALSVYVKNERAIKFYKNNGFKISSESYDEDNDEKEYLMKWRD